MLKFSNTDIIYTFSLCLNIKLDFRIGDLKQIKVLIHLNILKSMIIDFLYLDTVKSPHQPNQDSQISVINDYSLIIEVNPKLNKIVLCVQFTIN